LDSLRARIGAGFDDLGVILRLFEREQKDVQRQGRRTGKPLRLWIASCLQGGIESHQTLTMIIAFDCMVTTAGNACRFEELQLRGKRLLPVSMYKIG
jgi:hypothetical protein